MKDWEFEETIRWAIHDNSEMEANLKECRRVFCAMEKSLTVSMDCITAKAVELSLR